MNHPVTTHEAVETWKLAHRFVLDVYKLTNRLPKEEHYGMIPKVRTAAMKIASNIVEGYARKSPQLYLEHLSTSQAALEETKYSILVARDLGYISDHTYDRIMKDAESLSERLEGLHKQLQTAVPPLPENTPDSAASTSSRPAKPLFGVKRTFRDSLADFADWLRGSDRLSGRARRGEKEAQIWTEDSPVRNYLEESDK